MTDLPPSNNVDVSRIPSPLPFQKNANSGIDVDNVSKILPKKNWIFFSQKKNCFFVIKRHSKGQNLIVKNWWSDGRRDGFKCVRNGMITQRNSKKRSTAQIWRFWRHFIRNECTADVLKKSILFSFNAYNIIIWTFIREKERERESINWFVSECVFANLLNLSMCVKAFWFPKNAHCILTFVWSSFFSTILCTQTDLFGIRLLLFFFCSCNGKCVNKKHECTKRQCDL